MFSTIIARVIGDIDRVEKPRVARGGKFFGLRTGKINFCPFYWPFWEFPRYATKILLHIRMRDFP
jgi:hypothetical protein